jgi:hypothetical protein
MPPNGGWAKDHIEVILGLHIVEVFAEGVGVDDGRHLDAVQDHVDDRDHIGEALLLLADEGAALQRVEIQRGKAAAAGAALRMDSNASQF